MERAEMSAALTNAGLPQVAAALDTLLQPSIRLTSERVDESTLAPGASKLGGQPDLPAGTAWPSGKGAPLAFVAQIRLADAHPFDAQNALPADGLLWFFYDATQQTFGADPNDRGGWKVLFAPAVPTSLQRTAPPAALPASGRFMPCALHFSEEWTLPQRPALETPALTLSSDQQQRYDDFYASFSRGADPAAPKNRLLGHPDTLQDDMRLECQLASHGVTSLQDPRAQGLTEGAANWRLLLQLDSDEQAGMRWADAGMLYYWIERDALQARNFDGVWVVLQSD